MHLILLSASIALALAGVRAQLPPQVTPCIETCLAQAAAEDLDGCSVTDVQCLCANKKIQQDVFSCLQQQCSTQEFEEVQVFVAAECAPPASSTSPSTSARTSSTTTTHSEAPSTTHPASSSEEHTSERTSAVSTTTAPSTHLTSVTTTVNATSLANSNSTSLLSTTSTAPVVLSTASSNSSSSSSSEASTTVSPASPSRTNAAPRVGPGAVGMLVLGAVLGAAVVW